MRLSQLRRSGSGSQPSSQSQQDWTINTIAPFQRPISARTFDTNESVRILATGDVNGMSPAYLVCNEHGQSDWISLDDVKITDEQVVPLSQEQRTALQSGGYATSSTRR